MSHTTTSIMSYKLHGRFQATWPIVKLSGNFPSVSRIIERSSTRDNWNLHVQCLIILFEAVQLSSFILED